MSKDNLLRKLEMLNNFLNGGVHSSQIMKD